MLHSKARDNLHAEVGKSYESQRVQKEEKQNGGNRIIKFIEIDWNENRDETEGKIEDPIGQIHLIHFFATQKMMNMVTVVMKGHFLFLIKFIYEV